MLIDNGGGGIFDFLPVATQTDAFEAHVATPTEIDVAALAAAYGLHHLQVGTLAELRAALDHGLSSDGTQLIHVRTSARRTSRCTVRSGTRSPRRSRMAMESDYTASSAPLAPTLLETARLELTRPDPGDEADLVAFLGDERVGRWLGGTQEPQEAREALARHIAHWDAHGFGLWIARDRTDESFAGRGGLHLTIVGGHGEIEVGWAIAPTRWGEGLATELGRAAMNVARDALGVEQVVSFTLPDNDGSRSVMEKLGLSPDRDVEHRGLPHVLYRGPTA